MSEDGTVEQVLDRARWAPSGDNTQPWRFELLGGHRFRIHAHDTRDWCVYDLEGHASQIAVGALLETIALAASAVGLAARFEADPEAPETAPRIDVELVAGTDIEVDPLHAYIEQRATQRRPLSSKALEDDDKRAIEAAVGNAHRVVWIEGATEKRRMAGLLFRNAHIRLTTKEAYEVHKRIIEWDAQFSEDRIPDRALGLDALSLKLMKWAMASWKRVQILNRYFGGTLLPRLQMDVLPAMGCAAHFLLVAEQAPRKFVDYLAGGRALQRLWLAAASREIQFQPELTPLVFAEYVRKGLPFTADQRALKDARGLLADLEAIAGRDQVSRAVFAGRVGYGGAPTARSVRLRLARLAAAAAGAP